MSLKDIIIHSLQKVKKGYDMIQKSHQSLMEYLIEVFKPGDKTQKTLQWLRDKKGHSNTVTHSKLLMKEYLESINRDKGE